LITRAVCALVTALGLPAYAHVFEAPGPLELHISAHGVEVGELLPALGPVHVHQGRVFADLDFTARGWEGRIDIPTARFTIAALGTFDATALAELTGDRAVVHIRAAQGGSGMVLLEGTVALAGLRPRSFDLRANVTNLLLGATVATGASIDAELHAQGHVAEDGAAPVVDADVHVVSGRIVLPAPLIHGKRYLQNIGGHEDVIIDRGDVEVAAAAQTAPPNAHLPLRARIVAPAFAVRGREIHADVAGSLAIDWPAGLHPTFTGEVHARNGFIHLFGLDFGIDQVHLGWAGSERFDPDLDVRVSRVYPDTTLAAHVVGTLGRPQVALRSDIPIYEHQRDRLGGAPSRNRVESIGTYPINGRMELEAVRGDAGVGGIDWFWTYRY
jgi:hypothetical protein